MPDSSTLASILAVHWLVTMSPGANTALVVRTALANGRGNALAVIAGICASGAVWVIGASLGLKAVFLAWPWLFASVRLAGAAYLVWLGARLLRPRARAEGEGPVAPAPLPLGTSLGQGFLANVTNPKALIYFSGVFGAFLPPDPGAATVLSLVLVAWTCNLVWYGGLALMLSGPAARRSWAGASPVVDRVAGLALILFGLRLAVARLR